MGSSDRTSLGDRMKAYEAPWRTLLPRRQPLVVRIDGRAFHSYLRHAEKPFDMKFIEQMAEVAKALCESIQGAVLAYHQSDEISVLVEDWESRDAQPWFGGVAAKFISISAGIASSVLSELRGGRPVFDARVFTLPTDVEAANYLLWRQRDAVRNSVTMAAQAHFSHDRLMHLTSDDRQDLLWTEAGINWNDYPDECKRGQVVTRVGGDLEVKYTDRRSGETHTTTAFRTWWKAEPAPHFTLGLTGFLAQTIPPMPSLANIGADE
jgi:tRNA(His) guanylyltransferase